MMTINSIRPDIRSFVACLLLDGGTMRVPITEADAAYTMAAWDNDGVDYPNDMTPAMLADAWNSLLTVAPAANTVYNINTINEEDKIMTTKRISLDNGNTFLTAGEAIPEILSGNLWDAVVNMMDDNARETVSAELAPCTEEEFLTRYLEIAPDNLIIG